MTVRVPGSAAFTGAILTIVYTLLSAAGDASAKFISSDFAAPQLFALSGGLVAFFALIGAARKGNLGELKTAHPIAIGIRSISTVISASLFFYAFRALPLAEVFVFVGLLPIMAALISPLILNESICVRTWVALAAGCVGILFLFPHGIVGIKFGHIIAFLASFSGVISLVMSRLVSKTENKPLALIFYPHLLMFIVMAMALPFVFQSMSIVQFGVACLYSALLFVGRFILVRALAIAPTHIVLPVMNVQFLWMVGFGMLVFGEVPALNVLVGAAIVIASCVYLVYNASQNEQVNLPAISPRKIGFDWTRSRNLSRNHMSSWRSDSRSRTARQSALR